MRVAVLAVVVALIVGVHGDTSSSFQNGDGNGYTGTVSADPSDMYGLGAPNQWNDNGQTFVDGANDWCIGDLYEHSGYGYAISPVLRFDSLSTLIPSGSYITSAQLTLYLHATDAGGALQGLYLNASWNGVFTGASDNTQQNVGWRYRDKSQTLSWALPGAKQAGYDYVAGKGFLMPSSGNIPLGGEPSAYTAQLDIVEVQKWLTPATNFGLKLAVTVPNVHIGYVQPQRAISASRPYTMRPKLDVTYSSTAPSGGGSGTTTTSTGGGGTTTTSTGTSAASSGDGFTFNNNAISILPTVATIVATVFAIFVTLFI